MMIFSKLNSGVTLNATLDLHQMLGTSSKHIPQMVVKNGDFHPMGSNPRKKITYETHLRNGFQDWSIELLSIWVNGIRVHAPDSCLKSAFRFFGRLHLDSKSPKQNLPSIFKNKTHILHFWHNIFQWVPCWILSFVFLKTSPIAERNNKNV